MLFLVIQMIIIKSFRQKILKVASLTLIKVILSLGDVYAQTARLGNYLNIQICYFQKTVSMVSIEL